MRSRLLYTIVILAFVGLISGGVGVVSAQITSAERKVLDLSDSARVRQLIQTLSDRVLKNRSGAGAGTAAAGDKEEKKLAGWIDQQMREIGLDVHQERFAVRHYEYGEVFLLAGGKPVEAVSLHAAGGSWGSRDGVPYARGNENGGHRVRAILVDAGDGMAASYAHMGDVRGKAVLVRRGSVWPVYPILEAANRGAAALLMYDYPSAPLETIRQDSMWYHEQLPTASISKAAAMHLQEELKRGQVEIILENRIDVEDGWSQNVVGVMPGRELPDEWIIVSAHYDRWWKSANDNCSGVAVMLELARILKAGYRPRRSVMFLATGGEEAGIEATEFDWLAGSHAFVSAHPEILRRLVYNFNIDEAGWTSEKVALLITPEMAASQQPVLADLGLDERVTVKPGTTGVGVDSWNFGMVGGGAAARLEWGESGPKSQDPHPFLQVYHTQFDVYREADFSNLDSHVRFGALAVLRMDEAIALPIQFTDVATWIQTRLDADAAKADGISFDDARAALKEFRTQAERIEAARAKITSPAQATPLNRLLMNERKNLMPWLYAHSVSGFRTTGYATAFAALSTARIAAEKGDAAAATSALEKVDDGSLGWEPQALRHATQASPEGALEERLYWYTSGDWSQAYEHKTRLVDQSINDVYRRLKSGGDVAAEVSGLRQLEAEARGHLSEALFIVAGKLRSAAHSFQSAPLP